MAEHVDECLAQAVSADVPGETSASVSVTDTDMAQANDPGITTGVAISTCLSPPLPSQLPSAATKDSEDLDTKAPTHTAMDNFLPDSTAGGLSGTPDSPCPSSTLHAATAALLHADPPPSDATLDTLLKILRNIQSDPSCQKFRRVRLGNPKVQQAVVAATGGLGFLRAVGIDVR